MLKSTKEGGVMGTQAGFADTIRSSLCFQVVLGFFFNKGVRGGPRVLLNLAGLLVGLFIFVKLLPSRMTENALHAIPMPTTVWSGLSGANSGPDGLRIVVFGELDIATPVSANQEDDGAKSWTEMLCDQLACDLHISMVPPPDTAPWSVSSNELYAQGVERVFNETEGKQGPGNDYSYLSTSYPPQWKSWDLKEQIDGFLAMPKGHTPQSTLWVFSFGLWDVWALSALPVAQGKEAVNSMTRDIFEQVERLYAASMDPTSIAYSHVDAPKPAPVPSPSASESQEQAPTEENESGIQDDVPVEEQAAPNESATEPATTTAEAQEPPKERDTFQVFIPRVVDPSLLPGWRDLRAQIPSAHSKAEQMRNSAMLTGEWNDRIAERMVEWVLKDETDEQAAKEAQSADFYVDDTTTTAATPAEEEEERPIRDGFAYNLADYVVDRILERQMLNAHLQDGSGRGASEVDEGYRDVRNPCLQPLEAAAVAVSGRPVVGDVTLNIPYEKTENDMQTPSKPASGGAVVGKRAEFEEKAGLAYLSAAKLCDIPDDHLFYTPFALSQRAIQGIANETAEMVRNKESVRVKLDKKK